MIQLENNYSLWLRPTQPQIDEFKKIISNLAHRYGTSAFPPHITLLSSITSQLKDIKKKCEQIVAQQYTFETTLTEIDYTKNYYRNLYILANLDEELCKLYNISNDLFQHESNEPYMPHLSLLYGDVDKTEQQRLKLELDKTFNKIFLCERLDIYETSGKENNWRLIESFYLRPSE